MIRLSLAALTALSLAACAEHPLERELVVDGSRNAQYNDDFMECLHLAQNYDDGSVRTGATVGAVLSGLAGAAEEDVEGAIVGAALGGALGTAEASSELDEERRDVLIRCMQGRGHRVVG